MNDPMNQSLWSELEHDVYQELAAAGPLPLQNIHAFAGLQYDWRTLERLIPNLMIEQIVWWGAGSNTLRLGRSPFDGKVVR